MRFHQAPSGRSFSDLQMTAQRPAADAALLVDDHAPVRLLRACGRCAPYSRDAGERASIGEIGSAIATLSTLRTSQRQSFQPVLGAHMLPT